MKPDSPVDSAPLPVLYHGTTVHRARRILGVGFRRGSAASYTGTAVNLTESLCLAWEYGPERSGKILEVTLDTQTRWREAEKLPVGQTYDGHFAEGETDALRTYGGNVWLLWTAKRARIRALTIQQIMIRMVAEFRRDGPECGYNGDVDSLASLFWRGEAAAYGELRICAPKDFDVEAWKSRTIRRYQSLLSLAGAKPGSGKERP
jgi:hypothetical protein